MASGEKIIEASGKYPKPAERTFQYGTAGVWQTSKFFPTPNKLLTRLYIVSHEVVSSPQLCIAVRPMRSVQ